MAGDKESGVTIMRMDEGLDTGAMAMREPLPILPDMTAGELHDALAQQGARLMPVTLAAAERGVLSLTPQPESGVTYAEKISKSETRIDWSKPAAEVHNHCRGLSPFPGAWFELDGVRVKALRTTMAKGSGAPGAVLDDRLSVACGDGAIRLVQIQRAGKQPMSADEFLRGTPVEPGTVLN
jgi:methionyl-tRNA formyltransferase